MKQKAVIIDLDGTLVNNDLRAQANLQQRKDNLTNPQKRWDEFFQKTMEYDLPNLWCIEMVNAFNKQGYKILFLTGRMATETTATQTKRWLNMYVSPDVDYSLIMRPEKDYRKNEDVKLDIMLHTIMPMYDVLLAVDDKQNNIDMFRNLGIPALHCAEF